MLLKTVANGNQIIEGKLRLLHTLYSLHNTILLSHNDGGSLLFLWEAGVIDSSVKYRMLVKLLP